MQQKHRRAVLFSIFYESINDIGGLVRLVVIWERHDEAVDEL